MRRIPAVMAVCLMAAIAGAAVAGGTLSKKAKTLPFIPEPGDVVLQSLEGDLSELIAGVTGSDITHTGIVERHRGELVVIEAIGPVVRTPLTLWAKRTHGKYSVLRPKGALAAAIPAFLGSATARLGVPYDLRYEWDDAKLYCSELVYKAAFDAAGVKLGALDRLGKMNWRPFEKAIRKLSGGGLPLDQEIYTPVALTRSEHLTMVYSGL